MIPLANPRHCPLFLRAAAAFLALAVFACAAGAPVRAEETAAERYERLKGELAEINTQLDDAAAVLADEKSKQAALERQKEVIDEMIALNHSAVAECEEKLAAKNAAAAENRKALVENEQLFKERLVAIYKMNDATVLSQLLSVDSFSEFMQVADALRRVSVNDTGLLQELADKRAKLEAEQADIDALLADLQGTYDELAANAEDLSKNIQAQDENVSRAQADLDAKEAAYAGTAEEYDAAQADMAAIAAAIANTGSSVGDGIPTPQPAPAPEPQPAPASEPTPAPTPEGGDGTDPAPAPEPTPEPAPEPTPEPTPEPAPDPVYYYTGGKFTWPVPGFYEISCQFGSPDPNGQGHRGMDIRGNGIYGAPVVSCAGGTVIIAANSGSYGNYVVVDHGDGLKTLYAHCSSLAVGVGTPVVAGQTIAYVGSTGFVTGPHLHLEVQQGGLLNPASFF